MEILDADWLASAVTVDARYHLAKLVAWAQWEPQLLHTEHSEWRASLFAAQQPTLSREVLEARALALFQRRRAKQPLSGAN